MNPILIEPTDVLFFRDAIPAATNAWADQRRPASLF